MAKLRIRDPDLYPPPEKPRETRPRPNYGFGTWSRTIRKIVARLGKPAKEALDPVTSETAQSVPPHLPPTPGPPPPPLVPNYKANSNLFLPGRSQKPFMGSRREERGSMGKNYYLRCPFTEIPRVDPDLPVAPACTQL